jgi:hypothetical protein
MALETELGVYHRNIATLNGHAGKFVLIHGSDIVDYFAAYEDALRAGYQRFKLDPFLVKQIGAVPIVQHITRSVMPSSRSGPNS